MRKAITPHEYVLAVKLNHEYGMGCVKLSKAFKKHLGRAIPDYKLDFIVNGKQFLNAEGVTHRSPDLSLEKKARMARAKAHADEFVAKGLVDKKRVLADIKRIVSRDPKLSAMTDDARLGELAHGLAVLVRLNERHGMGPDMSAKHVSEHTSLDIGESAANRLLFAGQLPPAIGNLPELEWRNNPELARDYHAIRSLKDRIDPTLLSRKSGYPLHLVLRWWEGAKPKGVDIERADMAAAAREAERLLAEPEPVLHKRVLQALVALKGRGHIDEPAVDETVQRIIDDIKPSDRELRDLVLAHRWRHWHGMPYAEITRRLGDRHTDGRLREFMAGGKLPAAWRHILPEAYSFDADDDAIEALRLKGYSRERIASELGLSFNTIDNHLQDRPIGKARGVGKWPHIHKRITKVMELLTKKGLVDISEVHREADAAAEPPVLPDPVVKAGGEYAILRAVRPAFWRDPDVIALIKARPMAHLSKFDSKGNLLTQNSPAWESELNRGLLDALMRMAQAKGLIREKKK